MEFVPNTTIKFLTDVPLDVDSQNTIFWTNITQQTNYFLSKVKSITTDSGYTQALSFDNQMYQRYNRNTLRVAIGVESLYDCNYLMFQNTNYTSRTINSTAKEANAQPKWFYAFITDISYINDNTTEVSYTLDIIQTWFVVGRWNSG